jgi:hypothetical protein
MKKDKTTHRYHKHSLQKRREGCTPVAYSGQTALSRRESNKYTRYYTTTTNQATTQLAIAATITEPESLLGK